MQRQGYGVTLLELLIAIAMLGMIVLAFSSIDKFSRFHVQSSDKRAQVQNEASYVLEHMVKEIGKARGGFNNLPVTVDAGSQQGINVTTANGQIRYAYASMQINYTDTSNSTATLSNKITNCAFSHTWNGVKENFITVNITACYDPNETLQVCGSPENPSVNMQNRIYMPAVSVN